MSTRERLPAATTTDAAASDQPRAGSPAGEGPTGTAPSSRWRLPGLLGVAAVVCVSCYAGPILAVLGGLGLAGIASSLFIGAAGLLVTGIAAVAFVAVRRHRAACRPVPSDGPHAPARRG